MARRPNHTGIVMTDKLITTTDRATRTSKAIRRIAKLVGRTYGRKPTGPPRLKSPSWAAPKSAAGGCMGTMTGGGGSSPSPSRYDFIPSRCDTTTHQNRTPIFNQLRVCVCSSNAGNTTCRSNNSMDSSLTESLCKVTLYGKNDGHMNLRIRIGSHTTRKTAVPNIMADAMSLRPCCNMPCCMSS